MNLGEAIRTSLSEVRAHKLRSALTLTGIILGTTALVVMVSVIGGAAKGIEEGMSDLGFDGVMFVSAETPSSRLEVARNHSPGLRLNDLAVIERGRELIASTSALIGVEQKVRVNGRDMQVQIEGVSDSYSLLRGRVVEKGRFFNQHDMVSAAPVMVLGSRLKERLFGTDDAIGRDLEVGGTRFRIVGVMEKLGGAGFNSTSLERDNESAYVPVTSMQKRITGNQQVHAYMMKIDDADRLGDGEKEARALLRRAHRGTTDFRVENIGEEMLRIRKGVNDLVRNWGVVLAAIAGISLLVGGIGIFSVMQISLSERVYEIGLRKAMGAPDGAIFAQFLIESVSLSLAGGSIGVALGFTITKLAGQAFRDGLAVSPLSLVLAAGFAILIGLTAGVYPALRASQLPPVDALRAL